MDMIQTEGQHMAKVEAQRGGSELDALARS